ncbi:MAG TPA: immunoglobulin domain-containing protein [Verrucomicrobiae bacterium]|nr:immunoglobulin domain-containing protein [Verrucomicrobiae bacterium]
MLVIVLLLAACTGMEAQPTILSQPLSILNLLLGGNATFQVVASSPITTHLHYQWYRNGVRIQGATNSTYSVANTQATDCGAYSVRVNDQVAVVESATAELTASILTIVDDLLSSVWNLLDPTSGDGKGSNVGDTNQTGEPYIVPGDPGGSTVWYSWTPTKGLLGLLSPNTGVATFTSLGSDFDTILGVYTGSVPNKLVAVPSAINDDDTAGYLCSRISFNYTIGTTYLIAVDGYFGAQGNVVLNWNLDPGDSLPSTVATPPPIATTGTTSIQLSSPWPGQKCDWLYNGVVVATKASTFTVTNVADATVGAYVARFTTSGGEVAYARPIQVQVNTLQDGTTATNSIAWNKFRESATAPYITRAQSKLKMDGGGDSRGYSVCQVFSTAGNSDEPGEPIVCNQDAGSPGWYSYVAPATGSLVINTAGSGFNTVLGVYVGPGNSFSTLTNIGGGYTTNRTLNGQPVVYIPNVPAGQTNYIVVEGENGVGGTVHLNINLGAPVSIDIPPANQFAGPGTNVTLAVSASGATPLSYFWQFNGTNIPGATNGTLTVNMQAAAVGAYTVVVSNLVSVTSAQSMLSLVLPPAIVNQPTNQAVPVASSATFSCAATGGNPLAYQWQFGGTNCPLETNSSITLSNVQISNAGAYACLVTNMVGVVTSSVATLMVQTAPAINTQPLTHTVSCGGTASLTVAASGSPAPAYQWYFNGVFVGETNSVLSIPDFQSANQGTYSVVVSNILGVAASTPAVLLLDGPCRINSFGLANGAFQLEFVGAMGSGCIIEASSDLINWTPLMTNNATNGLLDFCDTNISLNGRFYRALTN